MLADGSQPITLMLMWITLAPRHHCEHILSSFAGMYSSALAVLGPNISWAYLLTERASATFIASLSGAWAIVVRAADKGRLVDRSNFDRSAFDWPMLAERAGTAGGLLCPAPGDSWEDGI